MGTKTVYDEQGHVIRAERYADVVIELRTSSGQTRSVFVGAAATPVLTTVTTSDELGRVTETSSSGSTTVKAFYDRLGRRTRSESWDGTTLLTWSETTYDASGRAVTTTDGMGHVTRTEYDGDGRVVALHYADNSTTRVEYDALGRKTADVDALGRRTEYGYDAQGRLTEVRQPAVPDPLNGGVQTVPVTRYVYDAYGNHVQTTDAHGRVTRWTYDEFGQELTRTLPAVNGVSATETTTSNAFGQMLTHTDFNGQVSKYFSDSDPGRADPQNPNLRLGRLTAVEYYVNAGAGTPAETVQYRYDAEGRRDKVLDSVAGTTDYDHDAEGRLVRVQGPGGPAQTINYGYDPVTGNLTGMWTDKSAVQYSHDAMGRLTSVTLSMRDGVVLTDPEVTQYGFDLAGNLTSITQQVGTTVVLNVTVVYDALNRLTSRVNKDGANNTLSSFNYTRLADGQIATLTEVVKQPDGSNVTTTAVYLYDALNRLVREQVDTAGTADDYTTDYTLDLVGNRTQRLTTKGSGGGERVEGTFDTRDRLLEEKFYNAATGGTLTNTLSYGYDTNGSLTIRTATAGGSLTQSWDVRGRLQSATDVQGGTTRQALYRYDPDNIRQREEVTTTTGGVSTKEVRLLVLDHQSPASFVEVVEERTESGLIVASYVYGSALDPISMARANQQVGMYLADGHSGVRQVVDLTPAVLAAYRYDGFGNKVATAGTFIDIVGYRGERMDTLLGQYYLRARPYNAGTGRFTAMDPFPGFRAKPITQHRYIYADNDPINRVDPSGRLFTGGTSVLTVGLALTPARFMLAMAGVAAFPAVLLIIAAVEASAAWHRAIITVQLAQEEGWKSRCKEDSDIYGPYSLLEGWDPTPVKKPGLFSPSQKILVRAANWVKNGEKLMSDNPADPFFGEELQFPGGLLWGAGTRRKWATVDHIRPFTRNGSNRFCNAEVVSQRYNSMKGNPDEE